MIQSRERDLAGRILMAVAIVVATLTLAACVAYAPVPVTQGPSTFDRSWAAAVGAFQDQGVAINEQDRASGTVRGTRGPVTVTAVVRTQADGRVRVEFGTPGGSDPALVERIGESYNRRMGR